MTVFPIQALRSAVLLFLTLLAGCAGGLPLNSDLIEARFGSYGVEIREQTERRRTSRLYSDTNGVATTRTYAVVDFLGQETAPFADVHQSILAGASIGRRFREAGFSIRKQHLFIDELEVPATYVALADLMQIELPETLAVHQYLFIVSKDARSWVYARITEVHHPDFLSVDELRATYGEILFDDSNRDSIHDFIGPPGRK